MPSPAARLHLVRPRCFVTPTAPHPFSIPNLDSSQLVPPQDPEHVSLLLPCPFPARQSHLPHSSYSPTRQVSFRSGSEALRASPNFPVSFPLLYCPLFVNTPIYKQSFSHVHGATFKEEILCCTKGYITEIISGFHSGIDDLSVESWKRQTPPIGSLHLRAPHGKLL